MATKGGIVWTLINGELVAEKHIEGYWCLYCQREIFPHEYITDAGGLGGVYVHDKVRHPSDFNQCDERTEN